MNGNHSWWIGKCKHLVKSTNHWGLKLTSRVLLVRRLPQSNLQALEHHRGSAEASVKEAAMHSTHMMLFKGYLQISLCVMTPYFLVEQVNSSSIYYKNLFLFIIDVAIFCRDLIQQLSFFSSIALGKIRAQYLWHQRSLEVIHVHVLWRNSQLRLFAVDYTEDKQIKWFQLVVSSTV